MRTGDCFLLVTEIDLIWPSKRLTILKITLESILNSVISLAAEFNYDILSRKGIIRDYLPNRYTEGIKPMPPGGKIP